MSLLAIKIGGSVITDKAVKFSINKDIMDRIAEELADSDENFILVHGGGSFGHPLAEKHEITSGYKSKDQLMGFVKTHQAMEKLNSKFLESLIEAGIPALPIQTSACTTVENDKITSLDTNNIEKFLDLGIVPVLYGDCVPDQKKGMTILSGDQLIAYLAKELDINRLVLGTDTDGVYSKDSKKSEKAEIIPKITPKKWEKLSQSIEFTLNSDVTGGMKNKIEVLVKLAKKGIESQIINAKKPGNLKKAIGSDIEAGTKITSGDTNE